MKKRHLKLVKSVSTENSLPAEPENWGLLFLLTLPFIMALIMVGVLMYIFPPFRILVGFILLLVSPIFLTYIFGSEEAKKELDKAIDNYGGPPGWE